MDLDVGGLYNPTHYMLPISSIVIKFMKAFRFHDQYLIYLPILLILCLSIACNTKPKIQYQSDYYTLSPKEVKQGEFHAEALSTTNIRSNYTSTFEGKISPYMDVKFSINGEDNELPFAVNHRMVVKAKNGKYTSPLFVFGQRDSIEPKRPKYGEFLPANTSVRLQVDMRPALKAMATPEGYTLVNGQTIKSNEFKTLYAAGSRDPLTWDWKELPNKKELELTDEDGDSIYTVTLLFNPKEVEAEEKQELVYKEWKLTEDISDYPQYSSDYMLADALYNMSLEEMIKDIRPDGAFMAGAKWNGVWTRDISYSILLSLAAIEPEAAKASLRHKVRDGKIIQDTGTGGSWPVSTDRMTWVLAAWEVYKVTGDEGWLKEIFPIIERSIEADLKVVRSSASNLFLGESSFLDWREQSYPDWMTPVDIAQSSALGTNAVMYESYRAMSQMAHILQLDGSTYDEIAALTKKGINENLWLEDRKHYAQFAYTPQPSPVSDRSETLGESLCVLFGIASQDKGMQIIQHTPALPYGVPTIFPQIPEIAPYHNNSMWPFVQAYWTWAAARQHHPQAVEYGIASMYRQAALFLTNKENIVAETGDFLGTEINSDRQLWSVAGNLAMIYRVFFGMDFGVDGLRFAPFVPPAWHGTRRLSAFPYREAILEIELKGCGHVIKSITLDDKTLEEPYIPNDLVGRHSIKIVLANEYPEAQPLYVTKNAFSPIAPHIEMKDGKVQWDPVKEATGYNIYRGGKFIGQVKTTAYEIPDRTESATFQVLATNAYGHESFLSNRIEHILDTDMTLLPAKKAKMPLATEHEGYTGDGYLPLTKEGSNRIRFTFSLPKSGTYRIQARYANGNGPINTENKCAIRTISLDTLALGSLVMPQLGDQAWNKWGFSSSITTEISDGKHTLILSLEPHDANMNEEGINEVLLDYIRLIEVR